MPKVQRHCGEWKKPGQEGCGGQTEQLERIMNMLMGVKILCFIKNLPLKIGDSNIREQKTKVIRQSETDILSQSRLLTWKSRP